MDDAVMVFFLLAMLAILINRFARTRREEQRLASELEAARGMQSLLVPATPPVTPGFTVESVYIPASEVGGDFFQILPGDDGSLVIVVGDVSGKGLKAAMTVSTIIGALRGCAIREPAAVLANLNRVLHGQITGFATCVAAWITADGTMTIANAGHIPPYRNGEELAVPGGLPLGVVETGNYEETQFEIAAGNRLTFVSDGVVEATNEKKELFGFARTQAISHQPAQAIAEAAKQFGQEDDISVLSVTRK
ncbi:MAG: SpoIIE family protein phosphatase [Acidobacteriaceae bacterium]